MPPTSVTRVRTPRHRLTTGLLALVALALATVGGASAATSFSDVPDTHPFAADIEWLVDAGVTTGFSDGTYRPGDTVTRGSMAAFLHRQAQYVFDRALGGRVTVPHAAFVPMEPDQPFTYSNHGYVHAVGDSGVTCGVAPVSLPHGAQITDIGMHAHDNGDGEVGVNLRAEAVFLSDSPVVVAEVYTAGALGAVQHPTAVANHSVEVEGNTYYLELCLNRSQTQDYGLYGVYLVFDPPPA